MLQPAPLTSRVARWPTVLLSAIGLLAGCDGNEVAAPPPTSTTVAGTVIASTTGEPVAGAEVSIGTATVTTGLDGPAPAWFAKLQLEITDVIPVAVTEEGLVADVPFEGSAGGRLIRNGTVVGVDHALFDLSGDAHLNVYLTITDEDGDQISANITGLATFSNSGQYLLQGTSGTIINQVDPYTGAFHATTGKYARMVGDTFEDLGFISGFSLLPPAGSVHATWYLH